VSRRLPDVMVSDDFPTPALFRDQHEERRPQRSVGPDVNPWRTYLRAGNRSDHIDDGNIAANEAEFPDFQRQFCAFENSAKDVVVAAVEFFAPVVKTTEDVGESGVGLIARAIGLRCRLGAKRRSAR
jgi:hypothetical protein